MAGSPQRVTIKTVAVRAGVSIGAASRILRQDPSCRVREATRRRVVAAAGELGYAPNAIAQALRVGQTRLVGILAGGRSSTPARRRKLDAVIRRLIAAGYQVMVESYEHRPGNLMDLLGELMRMRSCALMVLFGNGPWGDTLPEEVREALVHLAQAGTPVVGMDAEVPGDRVTLDRRVGFYRGTRHLIELGHRRIAFLGVLPNSGWYTQARMLGYRQALEEAGLTFDPDLLTPGERPSPVAPTRLHWGMELAMELLERCPDVTALVADDDRLAIGAVKAALRAGRRIPGDLSVIGFDGDIEAEFAAVPITSLAQPVEEMAEIATRFLLERLQPESAGGHPPEPRHIWLEPVLEERESCGPPGAGCEALGVR